MGAKGTPVVEAGDTGTATTTHAERGAELVGTDARTLDDRGRLSLPTKYRWAFTEGAIVLPWPGPCIAVMPVERFLEIERTMRAKQRDLLGDALARDALTELATHSMLDRSGRLFLEPTLRDEVGIDGDLLLIGRVRHLELWKPGARDDSRAERIQALHAHIATEAL